MSLNAEHIDKQLSSIFQQIAGSQASISQLTPLSGGASADTWLFDVNSNGATQELILRTSSGGIAFGAGIDKVMEAKVQIAAYNVDVPVAKVVYCLEEKDELGVGYIMERHEGETIPRKILRDEQFSQARTTMAAQCGEILAKIHSVDLNKLPQLPDQSAAPQLKQFYELYQSFNEAIPVFDLAHRWLKDHLPKDSRFTLVHGDFRNGNFIVNEQGIKTVLDWELGHFGDPIEDLAWLCVNSWRFGQVDKPVGGFGQTEELVNAYEKASGFKVEPESLKFWQVFGTFKWGVICLHQTFSHLSGEVNSVERAAIGRRVSETEIDLLELIKNS